MRRSKRKAYGIASLRAQPTHQKALRCANGGSFKWENQTAEPVAQNTSKRILAPDS
ncbi:MULTISPECIES: hypothetical protein [unclassified Tolypothrix]|uniref:hypothetical protein n=1 Tax=unclassified Tolypothrix TaxID=2649714 RepID=UPI00143A559A|nr:MULTISPECIES: hypothetical protein [unclassified Tolypothrix]MBE9084448.1 hypothetical protein [Tolypothrix sp. LEGE 11397]UYD32405.1 hypothetical protein HG267_25685 [Tolypothrix sp. PCC 7601]